MFCTKCGRELPDGSRFCGACGAKLSASQPAPGQPAPGQPAPPRAETAPKPAEAQRPAAASQPPVQQDAGEAAARVAPQVQAAPGVGAGNAPVMLKRRSPKMPLIAAIAAVVVIAVGIGVYFAFFAPYNIDDKAFPDAAVRAAVSSQADLDKDGKITRDEAGLVTSMNLSGSGIMSLDGLEKFGNLKTLDLSGTSSLYQADFSKVRSLTSLNVAGSGLTALDVQPLADLQSLKATSLNVAVVDLSKNTKLTELTLDQSVQVVGLENTGLREQRLMVGSSHTGVAGSLDVQGGGGGGDSDYEFTYSDDNVLTSYVVRYTYGTDTSSYGRRYTVEDGRVVGSEDINSSYSTTSWDVDYDERGRVSHMESYYSSSSSSSTSYYDFAYDESGKLLERDNRYSSGSNQAIFNYNDAGQLVQFVNSGSAYSNYTDFTYDQAGRVTSVANEYEEIDFEYNAAGQVSKKTVYWLNNGSRTDQGTAITFEYDSTGRLSRAHRVYGSSTGYLDASIEYDDAGNISRISRNSHSEYNGTSNDYDGTETFTYKRVFTAKDAPDVEAPLCVGDPTVITSTNFPVRCDVLGRDTQDPIVYYTCTYAFLYGATTSI